MTYQINNLDKFDEEFLSKEADWSDYSIETLISKLKSFILQDRQEAYNAGRQSALGDLIKEFDKDQEESPTEEMFVGKEWLDREINKLKQWIK